MNQMFVVPPPMPVFGQQCAVRRLTWWPELGVGYYPVEEGVKPYGQAYFDRYADQARSDIGKRLMQARVEFVAKHWRGPLLDIGIGSGGFIDEATWSHKFADVMGYDVNPAAKRWLEAAGLWRDPYQAEGFVEAVTLWDVLEHIPDFGALMARVREWVFVSIPIFQNGDHVLRSKHYRKDEHVWYFTRDGLIWAMAGLGFECVDVSEVETQIGREDIESFAFKRIA